jgi:hypothetical protein
VRFIGNGQNNGTMTICLGGNRSNVEGQGCFSWWNLLSTFLFIVDELTNNLLLQMTSNVNFTCKYSKLRNNMCDALRCSSLDSCQYIVSFFGILFHLKMPNPNLILVYQDQEVINTLNNPRFPQSNFKKFCNY